MILSADIGGTKTSIAISPEDDPVNYSRSTTYLNENFEEFEEIVKDFSSVAEISIMVLGIAGPISGRTVSLTNLDWSINADHLAEIFECRVYLLNDLQAAAHTVPYLDAQDLVSIYQPSTQNGFDQSTKVIVSVGTGLGVAKIYQDTSRIVFSSEGGHIGFSPHTKFQQQFLDYVKQFQEHVSCEMMVSSIGFKNLRKYLLEHNTLEFSEGFLQVLRKTPDFPRLLVKTSNLDDEDGKRAMELRREFSHMLGSYLGDMGLVHLPSSVYLTGGIGRNVPILEDIRQGFLQKANMSHVVKRVELQLITDPDCALHGTSWFASEHL